MQIYPLSLSASRMEGAKDREFAVQGRGRKLGPRADVRPWPNLPHAALLPKRDFSPQLFVPNCGWRRGVKRKRDPQGRDLLIGAHWQDFGLKKQARARAIPHIGRAPLGRCSKRETSPLSRAA